MNTFAILVIVCASCTLQLAHGAIQNSSNITIAPGAIASKPGWSIFVAVQKNGGDFQAFYSIDAIYWEQVLAGSYYNSLFYINGSYVITTAGNISYVSQDGNKFTPVIMNVELEITQIPVLSIQNDGIQTLYTIKMVSQPHPNSINMLVSSNSIDWKTYPCSPAAINLESAASLLILGGPKYTVSSDGVNWESWKIDFGKKYEGQVPGFITGQPGEIIAFFGDTTFFTSSDLGKTWDRISSNKTGNVYDAVYAFGYYAFVFDDNSLLISKDLASWYPATNIPFGIDYNTHFTLVNDEILFATLSTGYAFTRDLIFWIFRSGK